MFLGIVTLILTIIGTIVVWYFYHEIFDVYYYGARGCATELFWCFVGGCLLAGLLLKFWYIAVLIIVIAIAILILKQQ